MCNRDYTVLPDGAVFWLDTPEDYREAQQIIHEELGETGETKAGHVVQATESTHVA